MPTQFTTTTTMPSTTATHKPSINVQTRTNTIPTYTTYRNNIKQQQLSLQQTTMRLPL